MIQTIKPFIVAEVTHGQTDRQTDKSPIAKSRRSVAERNKNEDNLDILTNRTLYLFYLNTYV